MQVQKISNNNTTFGAKVNVIGTKFDEKVMATLSEKAKKIGLDKDVVELKFTNFKQESEDYFCGQDNCYIEGAFNELKESFRARFLPNGNGKGTEAVRDKIIASRDADLWQQEEQLANDYLDKLIAKFNN